MKKNKMTAVITVIISMSLAIGFSCTLTKAKTDYKSAKGILLPDVAHNRQIEETGECGEGLSYTLNDGILTIVGNGKISDGAFRDVPAISKVIINEGVSEIGKNAFLDTWNITDISLPSTLRIVGESAFGVCRSLESINIPEGVVDIGDNAFSCCFAMDEVYIPASAANIGESAFFGCVNLEKIVVSENNTAYDSRKDSNALIDTQTNILLTGCRNTIIPEGVTSIGKSAFVSIENLKSIVIPDGVQSIDKDAFYYCVDLKDVYIPESVEMIGENAFADTDAGITVHAKKDSYAWNYALLNKIAVIDTENNEQPPLAIPPSEDINSNTSTELKDIKIEKKEQVVYVGKKEQVVSVGKVKKYKSGKLKDKSVSFKLKVTTSGDGKVLFKIKKKNKKYIAVSKTGKVTLKKGIVKGVYKIYVTASATYECKKAEKIIKVVVK